MAEKTEAQRRKELIKTVEETHTDITVLHAIVGIMEARALSTRSHTTERRIIRLCLDQSSRLIGLHDAARDALVAIRNPRSTP